MIVIFRRISSVFMDGPGMYSLNALVFMVVSMLVLDFEAQEMIGSLVQGLHFRAAIAKE